MAKMTDDALNALVDQMLSESATMSGLSNGDSGRRERAIEYLNGEMKDLGDPGAGKSSVVSRDVSDAIGWILPGLSRVFLASEKLVEYEPENPNDMQAAQQATDYVNLKLMRDMDGHKVLYTAMFDALLHGNGILKHYWLRAPEYRSTRYSGLTEQAIAILVQDPDVEIVEQKPHKGDYYTPPVDPQTGQPMQPPPMFDLKIRRMARPGKLCLEVIPDEDFIIEPGARGLNEAECRFAAHRSRPTRTDLINRGFKRSEVEELDPIQESYTDDIRRSTSQLSGRAYSADPYDHKPAERVEVYECYMLVDYDGDGLAEWRQIIVAGGNNGVSGRVILSNEEYDGLPFSDLVPDPLPHVWRGRSIYDLGGEVQRIKTKLLREMLDNLYMSVTPERFADISRILNPESLYNRVPGNVTLTQGDPAGVIMDAAIPFVAKEVFPALDYVDKMFTKRTGLSDDGQGLDPEALQNQTATAVQAQQSALHLKREDYARNIANGLRRVFRKVLSLIVENQDAPCILRLRDKFVQIDPRSWNSHMDCIVNTGLGSGSRDRDMAVLGQLLVRQENIISQMGPDNPLVPIDKYRATLAKFIEATGLRDPDMYIGDVTPESAQQLAQKLAAKEDGGKTGIEKMKLQADAQKMQMQAQQEAQAMQMKAQMDAQKMQMEAQLEATKLEKQIQIETMQSQADIQVNNQKAQADLILKEREFEFKKQLELLKLSISLAQQSNASEEAADAKAMGANDNEDDDMAKNGFSLEQLTAMMEQGGGMLTPEMLQEAMQPKASPVEQAITQLAQIVAANNEALSQRMAEVMAVVAAPTAIERDPQTGRAVGARKVLN